ncbi:MAG: acyl-CoA thioesterase [Desulfopila sp.]
MRPKPFLPESTDQPGYIRDTNSGRVWYRHAMRILYADTDRSQVVYHANYLRYFEAGRTSLMRNANYPYKKIEESGYLYPVIKTELNYYLPLRYDDLIYIHTRPADLGLVKVQFDYLITRADDGQISCTGFTRHCAVNEKLLPVEVDEKTIALWHQFPR